MERLLNESEFAKTLHVKHVGYRRRTSGINCHVTLFTNRYDHHSRYIAELKYINIEGKITLLSLLIFDHFMTNDFIEKHNVEPYTYTYCTKSQNIPHYIKPFAYSIGIGNTPTEESSLPICVIYTGIYNVPSILTECDADMEYAVAKKLQNGEPITKLKSARN